MTRLSFLHSFAGVTSLGAIAALVACGNLSDPTRASSGGEPIATVSGALIGTTLPANTRVALVWKVGRSGTYAVHGDAPVRNGKFTMNLSAPPNRYFFATDASDYDNLNAGAVDSPTAGDTAAPSTSSSSGPSGGDESGGGSSSGSSSFAFASNVSPRGGVSGQIHQPLSAAVAGFVVYVDTNDNGKLDIEGPWAKPTDEVIGGNKELLLMYLRDGGGLDYEKLRDRSGILPQPGYNLAWDQGRWFPLNNVELKIGSRTKLPTAVCSGHEDPAEPPSSSSSGGSPSTGSTGAEPSDRPNGYPFPAPNDPNLDCAPDGRSWTYRPSGECPPAPEPAPQPEGLCATWSDTTGGADPVDDCDLDGYGGRALAPGEPVPQDWPCPIPVAADAGTDP